MNPIHELGFASLMLLALAFSIDFGIGALAALLAVFRRKSAALGLLWPAGLICVVLMMSAALVTMAMHAKIDEAIGSGAFGPPQDIAAQYGKEWHDSADFTARLGSAGGTLMIALMASVLRAAQGSWKLGDGQGFLVVLLVVGWLMCFLNAV